MKFKFLFLELTLLAIILVVGGLFFYHQTSEVRRSAEQALTSVSDLKTSQMAVWLWERRADAEVIRSSRIVRQLLKTPHDPGVRSAVAEYFDTLRQAYRYEAIIVLDSGRTPLLASPNEDLIRQNCLPGHENSLLNSGSSVVMDLHRCRPNGPIHFCLLGRIGSGSGTGEPATGFVFIVVDPHKFLYPFVQNWPTPSRTAETLLVRKEGRGVLYLNDLRHQKEAALNLRIDESHVEVPAVRAVVRGERGVLKGSDYRGRPVTGVASAIPGTPWVMVAKMDQAEIDAPAHRGAWMIGLITALTAIATLLGFALFWRHQRLTNARVEMASAAKAERALRESEERAQAMLSAIPDMMFRVNRDGIFLDYKADPEDLFVGKEMNLIGKGYRDLMPEAFSRLMDQKIRLTLESGVTQSFEYQLVLPGSKEFRQYEARMKSSGPDEVIAVVRDISEQKQVDEKLRNSEERFRGIFQGSPYGIVLADPVNHTFVLCNEAMGRMTGYRAQELMAMGVPDLHRPADLPSVLEGFEKHLRGEIDLIRNIPVLRQDGSVFFADVSTALIPLEGVTYLAGFFRDVTELRQAEQEIRDSRNFLDSIIEQSPISMWISDEKGLLIRLNQACCDTLQVKPGEVVNRYNLLEDRVVAAQGVMPLIRSVFEEGKAVNFDLTYEASHLTGPALRQPVVKELNVTIFPIRDSDGRITNAVVQHIDVSARKQTVERLRRLSALQAALHDPITLDQKLQRITEAVIHIFGADFARIWLTDRGDRCSAGCMHAGITEGPHVCRHREKCLHLRASSGRYTHLDGGVHSRVPFGSYKIGRIAAGLESSFLTNEVTHDPRVHNHAWAEELGLVSFAGYQLRLSQGEEIGVLGIFSKQALSPEDDAMLLNLGNLIVPAIQAARNEETLRASEEKYRGIFDESIAAIYVFDAQKRFVDSNQAGLDLLGYTREELLDLSIPDVDADPEAVLPAHGELLSGGRLVNYEHRLRRKDGAIVTVLNNSLALTNGEGTVTGMQSTLFNITRRKQAEELIKQSENHYRQLFELTYDGIVLADSDGRIMAANQAFCDLTGRSLDWLLGARLGDFESPASRARISDHTQTLKTEGQAGFDIEILRPDGTRTLSEVKARIVEWFGQTALLGAVRDITERRQMEDDLRSRNEELARFVYTVSHDLKSPLVTIQTFLGYLGKDIESRDEERVKADLGYIGRASAKMHDLLEGLLELSRIGRMKNPPEDLPFKDLVHAALDSVAGQIAERGVTIDLAEAPVVLHGDRLRLGEVFQNLIDNAVKFMGDQPEPRIEIGVEPDDNEPVFYVRDNGKGIDPRHLGKLFGLFEKLDPGTPGTGMGLALIKRIIEVHGGRIWAESDGPSQGTTFRFTLQGTKSGTRHEG
jgi:PAS domain S-box-containing protein